MMEVVLSRQLKPKSGKKDIHAEDGLPAAECGQPPQRDGLAWGVTAPAAW